MKERELTLSDVHELISYDPESGKAFHNKRSVKWFRDTDGRRAQHACNLWNARYAGKEISGLDNRGYIRVGVLFNRFRLHRLIWFRQTGEWPDTIDHINGNITDNRWRNLRNVTQAENNKNSSLRKDSKFEASGISQLPSGNYRVVLANDHIGVFASLSEAINTRNKEADARGFSIRHGISDDKAKSIGS